MEHLDQRQVYLDHLTRAASPEVVPVPIDSHFTGAAAHIHRQLFDGVDALQPEVRELARWLYHHPERGFAEHESVQAIVDLLGRHGITAELGVYGLDTAFHAQAGSGDGPHFAIIAEYDALPGVGHACGHNIITGIAVASFLAVARVAKQLGGRVSLIGTPAEENGGGKEYIIQAGGFDDVDAAAMVHPAAGDSVTSIVGQPNTGVRRVGVTYHGRAAHAAGAPWLGINALDAVVTAYQSVAQLRQHILPIDRVHGIITDGGAAPNVVPETASALFYVRSAEIDTLKVLTQRVVEALEGAALSTGTRAEIEVDPVPPYLPLKENVELGRRWAQSFTARGRVVPPPPSVPQLKGGSTDMGNVTQYIPAIQPSVGLGGPEGIQPHNAAFADLTLEPSAFEALADAAAAVAATAADYLADPQLRAAVQAEFETRGGRFRWEG